MVVKSNYLINGELRLFQTDLNRHEKLMSFSDFLTLADEHGKDGAIGLRYILTTKTDFLPVSDGLSS